MDANFQRQINQLFLNTLYIIFISTSYFLYTLYKYCNKFVRQKLVMKLLIIGLGSLGTELARSLVLKNFEVSGVDLNPTRLRENNFLDKNFQLDACKREDLLKLPLDEYQKILVCLGSKYERSNLLAALLLNELCSQEIYVLYLNELQKKSLEVSGITNFINFYKNSITEILHNLTC